MKKDEQAGQIDPAALEEGAVQLLEDEQASNSLFAKLGHSFSRHSRPLLMAAAAILLAITTIQLVKNPDSSLYGLFNSEPAQSESSMDAPATENAPALEVAPEGNPAIAPNAAPADVPVMEQPAGAWGQSIQYHAVFRQCGAAYERRGGHARHRLCPTGASPANACSGRVRRTTQQQCLQLCDVLSVGNGQGQGNARHCRQ